MAGTNWHGTRKVASFQASEWGQVTRSAGNPQFSGLAIANLYTDSNLMSKSGCVVISAEAALEYGYTDTNGKQPPILRQQKGSPTEFFKKSAGER
jgi:hypothetical protein